MKITLPFPPTINHYYGRDRRGWVYIKPKGRKFRQDVWAKIESEFSTTATKTGPIELWVEIYPPDKRPRDIDNIMKALQDSMQRYVDRRTGIVLSRGLYVNDSQITVSHAVKNNYDPTNAGICEVEIKGVKT